VLITLHQMSAVSSLQPTLKNATFGLKKEKAPEGADDRRKLKRCRSTLIEDYWHYLHLKKVLSYMPMSDVVSDLIREEDRHHVRIDRIRQRNERYFFTNPW
jgi:hypothetical protein